MMGKQFYTWLVKLGITDVGFTGCSSHTGRRSAISTLANKGVGIRIIQKFSGHRQLQSVQHYLDANEEMVKNAVELVT